MATARTKRPLAARTNDVDRLATKLGTTLNISDAANGGTRMRKGTRIAQATKATDSPVESKVAAMKSINNALQSLASTAGKKGTISRSTAVSSATTGRAALNILRKLNPELIDTERAALAMVGKILAMEMHDVALPVLEDTRRHLPSFYTHAGDQKSNPVPLSLLQIPLPNSSIDQSIQSCIQTYLIHTLCAVAHVVATKSALFDAFCDILDGPSSLSLWVPFLSALSRKSLDGLCKRAYVTLTTCFSSPPATTLQILKIRFHALRILLLSSELDVSQFWEQCLKFAASYACNSAAKEPEDKKIEALLSCFARIELAADGRREGKGWISFCEYWLGLARRAGDMQVLNIVASFIRNSTSTSDDHHSVTRACTILTQVIASLDGAAECDDQSSANVESAVMELRGLHTSLQKGGTLEGRLLRTVERCRKGCLKELLRPQSNTPDRHAIIRVLDGIIILFEHIVQLSAGTAGERTDAIVSSLDTFFQLATTVFDAKRADACDNAYDYLARGQHLVDHYPLDTEEDKRSMANCLRCLAGAFANFAGSLYKADRHSIAIRFLTQACPLSTRASQLFAKTSSIETKSHPEKDQDVWSTHKAQVYRRWELLGVCYVKTSDRKLAHKAFVQGVVTYPFEDELPSFSAFPNEAQVSSSLLNAIDRLTNLAAIDLRLDPSEVSLLKALRTLDVPASVVGFVLTRQACSLAERSKALVRSSISKLLADLLIVYDSTRFPIRRAGALALVLEHTYYAADMDEDLVEFRPKDIIRETGLLLSEKASAGEDTSLIHLRPYNRATILLWAILHAHRAAESLENIATLSGSALKALGTLVAEPAKAANPKRRTVFRGRKAASSEAVASKPKPNMVQRAATSSSKCRTTRSNSTRQSPKTPGSPDSAYTNTAEHTQSREIGVSEYMSLAGLIFMVSELLDLSGLILIRMELLVSARRFLEKAGETMSEAYFYASATLSSLLLKLGKSTMASNILTPLASQVCKSTSQCWSAVLVLLRSAELLALSGDLPESLAMYENASQLSADLPEEENGKGVSAYSRIRCRAVSLERVATGAIVFAAIQQVNVSNRNQPGTSLNALLQALRLLNRATETLARLNPSPKPASPLETSDPFAMSDVKDALPATEGAKALPNGVRAPVPGGSRRSQRHFDGLEWRIANALLDVQFALAQAYAARGSAREAEYFEQQAEDLSRALGFSAMTTKALLLKSELHMALGNSDEVRGVLEEAGTSMKDERSLLEVDVRRAMGDRLLACSQEKAARGEFDEAAKLFSQKKEAFDSSSKPAGSENDDSFAPVLQAKIMRQQAWLMRDVLGEEYERLLEELYALPQSPHVEVHVNSLLGRLALYDIHERFRADMSLSSLAESTIALPMGMACEKVIIQAPPQDILDALGQADEHYISDLSRFSECDSVINVRAAAVAEVLVSIYQASLGITIEDGPVFASRLLDMASSITLRRELLDAISFKFPNPLDQDDMRWPSESQLAAQKQNTRPMGRRLFANMSDGDDEDDSIDDKSLRRYWEYILKKHQSEGFIPPESAPSEVEGLPDNWMVVTISLTQDKNALLVSRQRPKHGPMVFCVPLKGRRDEEEGHFTFDQAMTELNDIIKSNDEGARGAAQIKSDDKEAKITWWASRKQLDQRMKDLVENIEFCWLGAFKTILGPPMDIPSDIVSGLRTRFEKAFKPSLRSHEKKSRKAKLRLEESLLELIAALPPTCRDDEELQDLVYFVLDLYHFHGLPVALAEVDIDVVVVDLRSALEEFHAKAKERIVPVEDAHTFLVLDKNVQGIPWESLPILRGHNVSRVPSVAFITDRLAFARCQRGLPLDPAERSEEGDRVDRAVVDPSKGYFVLNPTGDLSGTEGRFKGWVNDLRKVGWDGVVGTPPSEQQFLSALSRKDLVVYFGHGGAEQYARSHKIRHLQRCAATMLWGCSSGALREMGEFDRIGTPNNYMLAGCPSLVANLWDVTDRDTDKFAMAVLNKLRLEPGEVGLWQKGKRGWKDGKVSVVAAVAQSRDACKLKYLTGAAAVVYGIPFYL